MLHPKPAKTYPGDKIHNLKAQREAGLVHPPELGKDPQHQIEEVLQAFGISLQCEQAM